MKKKIYVLTACDGGWDNVRGVYAAKTEEEVYKHRANELDSPVSEIKDRYIVHHVYEIKEI